MDAPLKEIERLIGYCDSSDVQMVQAVYVTPAQQLRNAADRLEQKEKDLEVVWEWLREMKSK